MRKLKHILPRITETLYYTPKRFIKNVWFFRKELSQWWNWDQEPTLSLLKRSLEGMYDAHVNDKWHKNHKRHANNIKVCIHLLDRLCKDEYDISKFDYDATFTPLEDKPGYSKIHIEVTKKYDLPSKNMGHKLNLRKQDKELLFKLLEKHIDSWWT